MSASIELKKQQVEQIVEKIKASKSVVLVDYSGLTVKEDTELRSNFRKNGVEYRVLKNTLLKRAFNELGYTEFDNSLNGATAVAFGLDDAVAGAKTISEAIKKYNKIAIKCGLLDGAYLDENGVKVLATIPSKEVLVARLLGVLTAPIRNLAVVANMIAEKQNA